MTMKWIGYTKGLFPPISGETISGIPRTCGFFICNTGEPFTVQSAGPRDWKQECMCLYSWKWCHTAIPEKTPYTYTEQTQLCSFKHSFKLICLFLGRNLGWLTPKSDKVTGPTNSVLSAQAAVSEQWEGKWGFTLVRFSSYFFYHMLMPPKQGPQQICERGILFPNARGKFLRCWKAKEHPQFLRGLLVTEQEVAPEALHRHIFPHTSACLWRTCWHILRHISPLTWCSTAPSEQTPQTWVAVWAQNTLLFQPPTPHSDPNLHPHNPTVAPLWAERCACRWAQAMFV